MTLIQGRSVWSAVNSPGASLVLTSALALLALAAPASALDAWRTQVQVSVGSGTGTQFAFDGGDRVASSSQTLSTPSDSATSRAEAALNAGGYVPTLRAHAIADPTRAQAVAWGVQGYTNTSGAPLDTALVFELDAIIAGGNDIDARVYLFQDDGFEFYIDSGTMLFESSSRLWPGFEPFANNLGPTGFDIDIKNRDGLVDERRQFDFTVAPGESFYVWARLVATADRQGEVDAFSTLTASFTNIVGLTPAGTPPPPSFRRGDCNDDGVVDLSDVISNLSFQFTGGPPSSCPESCELNADSVNDVSDNVYLLLYLFAGGPMPEAPYPDCGEDPLPESSLGCARNACQ